MSICTSFQALFDKASQAGFSGNTSSNNFFEVYESKADSSPVPMKRLRVEKDDAAFTSFGCSLVKSMKDITETRSRYLRDSDCDGIAFVSIHGHEGLILAELKSRFSAEHLCHAYRQMLFSFLKLHAMLSMCKEYSPNAVTLHFVAACQCFENDIQEAGVYDYLNKAEEIPEQTFEGSLLRKLIEKHSIEVRLGDVTRLWDIPLSDTLEQRHVVLSLQLTQHYGDDNTVFSM